MKPAAHKRILYIQYTNPAAYPPLEHSSRILADHGWEVLFLGTGSYAANEMEFEEHPRILVKRMAFCAAGVKQKIHYARYFLWCLFWVLHWKPCWIYASDPLACPIAWLLMPLVSGRVIYHEHDSPRGGVKAKSEFQKITNLFRKQLARESALVILPNQQRLDSFLQKTGRINPAFCVWNCPEKREVSSGPGTIPNRQKLKLIYHGSINPRRLPEAIVQAMVLFKDRIELKIIGYETIGHQKYFKELETLSERLGIRESIFWTGILPARSDVFRELQGARAGLSFMPMKSDDINLAHMVGASNKPFDYMACGLALLVSDLPDWKEMYVDSGYGLACNPEDPESIESAFRWFLEHPDEMRAMGEAGRKKILTDWNYETQFQPVLEFLESRTVSK